MGNHNSSESGGHCTIPPHTKSIDEVFTIGKELGRGHFARVVVAQDKHVGKKVAIKIIDKKEFQKNAESVRSEVDILMKVGSHPHVVNLIDTFEDAQHYYLVMEFCPGGDLFSNIIAEGKFSEKLCKRFCRELATAIQYIHKSNITHRDLKPENILLTSHDLKVANLKVADFGLSKLLPEPTAQMRTVCGTWAYCAPEVISRQKYGPEVDNWTLGVLMFILISGYHPFDMYGDLPECSLLQNIKKGQFDYNDTVWNDVSQEAKDLINALLVVNPQDRLSIEDYLKSNWILSETDRDMSNVAARMQHSVKPRIKFRALILAKLAAKDFHQKQLNRMGTKEEEADHVMKMRHDEKEILRAHSEVEEEHGVKSPAPYDAEHFKWTKDPVYAHHDDSLPGEAKMEEAKTE